jgi:hypothetical protein
VYQAAPKKLNRKGGNEMARSKNPYRVVDVPQEIIALASEIHGIVCNLRPSQQPIIENEPEDEKMLRKIKMGLFDTWFFCEEMGVFLKTILPGNRLVLVCQGAGEDIFSFVTNVTRIFWADGHYPRIDFERRPRVVQKIFGHSNLWGGFILAAAKVGRVKKQAGLGYDLLLKLAKRSDGIKNI